MSLKSGKKITRRSWDELPITDAVIDRVNLLGKDQPEQLTFKDRHGRPIGDVELTGVAGDPEPEDPEPEAPQNVETIQNDLDEEELMDAPEVLPEPVPDPTQEPELSAEEPIDMPEQPLVETVEEETLVEPSANQPEPLIEPSANQPEPTTDAASVPAPARSAGVRRSTRARKQTKPDYIPSMHGTKYDTAYVQAESGETLHPDQHMFFTMTEEEPDAVGAIMTQLSLKADMREWGDPAKKAVTTEMKQLHFRDTFKPLHYWNLDQAQKGAYWSPTCS